MLICLEKPVIKKTKDNLPSKPAVTIPTPLELSRLKAERDRAFNQAILAERQAQVPPNYDSIDCFLGCPFANAAGCVTRSSRRSPTTVVCPTATKRPLK